MQVLRTIGWVLITAILVAFVAMNWTRVPVNFWPLSDGNALNFMWPVGFVAIVFFLLGLVPMWLVHRAARWRANRRIAGLENALKAASVSPAAAGSPALAEPDLTQP